MTARDLYPDKLSIEEEAQRFHENNPQVAVELLSLAHQLRRRGHRRYGIAGLFEVLRYQRALSTYGSEFKLNNNFRAFYARFLMKYDPRLDGFFEVRVQRTGTTPRRFA